MSQAAGSQREAEVLAQILWDSVQEEPHEEASSIGLRGLWRSKIYYPLVRANRRRIREHRNPEPLLSLRLSLQKLSGAQINRTDVRYEGVIGGQLTAREFEYLRDGRFSEPIILVSGFPRSGTTSLQAVVRAGFPDHVCELHEEGNRFSLWEQPKHDSSAMLRVASECPRGARILLAVRDFKDALASLIVGRGGWTAESNEADFRSWLSWHPIAAHPQTVVVPFSDIAASRPADLLELITRKLEIDPKSDLQGVNSYRDLLSLTKSGDPDDVQKGNLPHRKRESLIDEALSVIDSQFGSRSSQISAAYQAMIQ